MSGDDDFGPVLRGGPAEEVGTTVTEPDADGFGPPLSGRGDRRRRARRRRPVKLALAAFAAVALAVAGAYAAVPVAASARVERVPVAGLADAPVMSVLVVGSDSRQDLSPEEARELGTGRVGGKRTDTIFVLSARGGRTAILSFPRDLYVTRCDGSQGRINAAFAREDGASCLVRTVTAVSGIPITHYLEVSFLSFVSIVDAVGGVEVCVDEPIRDASASIDLPAGCSRLDGARALGFVRVRKIDNDLGRIARQQYFLRQLAAEVAAPGTLLNLPRLWSTARAAGGALVTDEGFGTLDLARLGLAARGMATDGTATHVVPTTFATIGGASVLLPVEDEAEALYARFRDGSILDEPLPGETATPGATPGAAPGQGK